MTARRSRAAEPGGSSLGRALGRYGLGLAQMTGAVAGLVLVVAEGLTPVSIAVVAFTTLLTGLSRWLFPRGRPTA